MLLNLISRQKSIRAKLIALIIGVTAISLLTSNIIELAAEYTSSRYKTKSHLEHVTDLTQERILYYEQNHIPLEIYNFMKSMKFDHYIDKVCYYRNKALFAFYIIPESIQEYGRNALCPTNEDMLRHYQNDLTHTYEFIDITSATGETFGKIFIKYDLEGDFRSLIYRIIIGFITIFIALLFAYTLASKLQLIITKPIYHLSGLAAALTEKEDYTLRATKFNDDEIGLLAQTFNAMIEKMGKNNAAMREAQINAEKNTLMKSEFLAVMSHEIRTPMNGIIGMADLLEGTRLNNKQKHYISVIIKSAHTLLELINDILDFSKIEAGKLELEQTHFDITQTIEDVIDMLEYGVRQKGLDFKFMNNLSVRYIVVGDPTRIKQVLVNLTSNAIKFTETGHITISIAEDQHDHNETNIKEIWFSVSDTGIGIPADRQESIFNSFSQADTSTTRKYGGSGLGLSICKNLISMMNGSIGIQSTVGIGSTFWFSIPFVIGDGAHSEKNYMQVITSERRDEEFILLVEDNQTNLMITEEILKSAGYRVISCKNGAHAVSVYKKTPFSTILMDCHMPIMDGFEATKEIRNYEKNNNLPHARIIALTASAQLSDRDRCYEAGMDDFLSKPFRKHDLLHKLISKRQKITPIDH